MYPLLLACQSVETARKKRLPSHSAAVRFLAECVDEARGRKDVAKSDYILALLTLNLSRRDPSLVAEASTLINSSYQSIVAASRSGHGKQSPSPTYAEDLYIADTFCDYIDNFNPTLLGH